MEGAHPVGGVADGRWLLMTPDGLFPSAAVCMYGKASAKRSLTRVPLEENEERPQLHDDILCIYLYVHIIYAHDIPDTPSLWHIQED